MQFSALLVLASTLAAAAPVPGSVAQVYRGDFPNYYLKSKAIDEKHVYFLPSAGWYSPSASVAGITAQVYRGDFPNYYLKSEQANGPQVYFRPHEFMGEEAGRAKVRVTAYRVLQNYLDKTQVYNNPPEFYDEDSLH